MKKRIMLCTAYVPKYINSTCTQQVKDSFFHWGGGREGKKKKKRSTGKPDSIQVKLGKTKVTFKIQERIWACILTDCEEECQNISDNFIPSL